MNGAPRVVAMRAARQREADPSAALRDDKQKQIPPLRYGMTNKKQQRQKLVPQLGSG